LSLHIHVLDLGRAETDSSFCVWGRSPGTRVNLAINGYLILGGETPIVIDTGCRVGRIEKGIHAFQRTSEQTLAAALARFDLDVSEIGILALTHLHSDHTGELDALPNARILVQREELQYAAAPYYPASMFDRADIAKLVDPLFDRVEPITGDLSFADGVTAVHTGGHSPGHQQIEVQLESGLAIITGDNAYLLDAVEQQIPPGYVTSIPQTMRALADIRRRATHILPMHDPKINQRYPDGLS
jgi:N-acyl homoserine lactone hydrolase